MAKDRVHPLKFESPDTGGTETDQFPTSADANEDFLDCRGVTFQSDSSNDENTYVSRDGAGNMIFYDGVVAAEKTLTELLTGSGGLTENAHKILRQLIHFIDDGPAEGFTSGAYREVTNPGTAPTAIIWWESSSKLKKIVELGLTWSGVTVTQEQWKVYDTDGSTVLATVTDAISYSGIFETNRTRTIAVP